MLKKSLFLDRDGVINVDYGYVHTKKDFHFIEGIFDLTKLAQSKGYNIFVVTNQSGIARGLYNEADFKRLSIWMSSVFESEGVRIIKVYYSPFHPVHGRGSYKKDDFSRKPKPGMIQQAVREFDINLDKSILIGDNITDIEAGNAAGIGQNLLLSKKPEPLGLSFSFDRITNLDEAKNYL